MHRGKFETAGIYASLVAGAATLAGGLSWGAGEIVKASYSAEDAAEYVGEAGYDNVKLRDVDSVFVGVRGCGEEDLAKYEFEATSFRGEDVGVIVCKGIFKNATIRQD